MTYLLRLSTFEFGEEIDRQLTLPGETMSLAIGPGRKIVIEELQVSSELSDGRQAIKTEAQNPVLDGLREWAASEAPPPDPSVTAQREERLAEIRREMEQTWARGRRHD